MRSQRLTTWRRLIIIVMVGLLLMVPACFRVVRPEPFNGTASVTGPNIPATASAILASTVQYKFLWMMEGANAGERFGASIISLGDIDGDGTIDIAVGAISASPSGKRNAGSVYVISLRNVRALYRLDGQNAGDEFGHAMATLGDIDGDKVADFIVGVPLGDVQGFADAGYTMIYSGKDGKLIDCYTGIGTGFRLGHSVAGLGDLNGDGFPDFAIGTPFASLNGKENVGVIMIEVSKNSPVDRSPITVYGEAAGDKFGSSITSIGDIDRDGVPDIAIGSPGVKVPGSVNTGRVYIISGRNGSILYRIDGQQPGLQFGFSITRLDDINGDNVPDLAVGAPRVPGPSTSGSGRAYVFSGQDGSLIYELSSVISEALFGYSIAGGDFDGDGRTDVMVGDPGANGNAGVVHVFSGRDGKSFFVFTNNPNKKEEIGCALSPARDLNNDGRIEMIAGAYSAPNLEGQPTGRVYVLSKQ